MSLTLSFLFIPYAILVFGLVIFMVASFWHLIKFSPLTAAPVIMSILVVLAVCVILLFTQQALPAVDWSQSWLQINTKL